MRRTKVGEVMTREVVWDNAGTPHPVTRDPARVPSPWAVSLAQREMPVQPGTTP